FPFILTAPANIRSLMRLRLSTGWALARAASSRKPARSASTTTSTSSPSNSAAVFSAMSDPNQTGPVGPKADEPLSPEALAMFAKARRSFGISIGILLLGFMAIGIALVYRVMRDAPPPTMAESVVLPPGADVVSAMVSDGALNVTYVVDGVTTLALFDPASGELVRVVVLGAE